MTTYEQWSKLEALSQGFENIKVVPSAPKSGIRVLETWGGRVLFDYDRFFDGTRKTRTDLFGLVGLTECDFNDRKLFLTEGVSDFLSVKTLLNKNVLGRTHRSISRRQSVLLTTLFDEFVIILDRDSTGASVGADLLAALRGKKVKFIIPEGYKDITLEILSTNNKDYVFNRLQA